MFTNTVGVSMGHIVFALLLMFAAVSLGEPVVSMAIESRNVTMGEAFIFQIKVSGAENTEQPLFSENDDFTVRAMAPSRNQSTQVSIVNGKYTKTVNNDVLYNFQLSAKRLGRLVIPPIKVVADGKTYSTSPVSVTVTKAEVIDDIKLELSFSDSQCYVGQPVMATWRWIAGRQAEAGNFELPLLSMPDFKLPPYETPIDQRNIRSYTRIPNSANLDIIGRMFNSSRDGIEVLVLEFKRPVIPQKAGSYVIQTGSVTCSIVDNRARRRSYSPFSFFDGPPMRNMVIQGGTVSLTVKDVPTEGKPDNFSGIIGKCQVEVDASPLEVNVGDPIVMTIRLKGLPFPDAARLPKLSSQGSLTKNFRISEEEGGAVQGDVKTFQCTIRALNAEVTEIPPLSIPYLDSGSNRYENCVSNPIPIKVHAVKTITASDAVGATAAEPANGGAEVKALDDGIAHNYAWGRLLENKSAGLDSWTMSSWKTWLCLGAAGLYLLLSLADFLVRLHGANPELLAAKRAASVAYSSICSSRNLSTDELYDAWQEFLRAKLSMPPGAITYGDVEKKLQKAGLPKEDFVSVKSLFDAFEAARYANGGEPSASVREEAKRLVKNIDRRA